jgi:ADP-heptose:LPS heptosyltransferase
MKLINGSSQLARLRQLPAANEGRWPPLLSRVTPQKVVVFRALHLGDLLCAVPALRALRAALPQAHIALVGLPWASSFVQRYSRYLDELIEFPGYPGFPEREASGEALLEFQQRMRERQFDLAVQLHGTGDVVNDIVAGLGARHIAGFHPPLQAPPSPHFTPWPGRGHEIRRMLAVTRHLGASDVGESLEFPMRDDDRVEAAALMRQHQLSAQRFVCLHAGARLRSRRWPVERFAQVASAVIADGWPLVLTGAANEADIAAQLLALVPIAHRVQVIDLLGATTLGGLAALVSQARLAISNDTGLSHVATAVATPSVIVSSGGDVARWAPLDRARHRVFHHDLPCRPCDHELCPTGHGCALAVGADTLIAAVREALAPRSCAATTETTT